MWRFIRAPRTSLALSALRKQMPSGQVVMVQRVKIRKPHRLRTLLVGSVVIYICYGVYVTIVLMPLARAIPEDMKQLDRVVEPMFYPLPFTTRAVEMAPYKGTDPEWQAYIKINKDRDLQERIRDDMKNLVRQAAEANSYLARKCGKGMKVRRYWLDIAYPYRPPPKFMRLGVEVTPEKTQIVTKEIPYATHMRIERVLKPSPLALSMFSFWGTLFKQNLSQAASYFGYEFPSTPQQPGAARSVARRSPEQLQQQARKEDLEAVKGANAMAAGQQSAGRAGASDSSAAAASATTATTTTAAPAAAAPTTPSPPKDSIDENAAAASAAPKDADPKRIPGAKDIIPYDAMRSHIDGPWNEFLRTAAQTWMPTTVYPPSGCVKVSGFVELEAPRAMCVIEVDAFWNPKTSKYDTTSMKMKLRSYQPRMQAPLAR